MKKVLFTATLRSHIGQFHQPYLKFFKNAGYQVHIAVKDNSSQKKIKIRYYDQFHSICYERLPFKRENMKKGFGVTIIFLALFISCSENNKLLKNEIIINTLLILSLKSNLFNSYTKNSDTL